MIFTFLLCLPQQFKNCVFSKKRSAFLPWNLSECLTKLVIDTVFPSKNCSVSSLPFSALFNKLNGTCSIMQMVKHWTRLLIHRPATYPCELHCAWYPYSEKSKYTMFLMNATHAYVCDIMWWTWLVITRFSQISGTLWSTQCFFS